MKQYKVITQNDKLWRGKFSIDKLNELLNTYAKEGWIVKSITTGDINTGLGRARQEIIIVLEADA